MADISAKDVAALRKVTGAGMMDCKKALAGERRRHRGGQGLAAREGPRRRGEARRAAPPTRARSTCVVDGNVGALVELNCETDFVAKGADFKAAVAALAQLVVERGRRRPRASSRSRARPSTSTSRSSSAKLGEKIELGRVVAFETTDGLLDGYKHIQNERGTIGVLVELGGVDPATPKAQEVAHDIALHIASGGAAVRHAATTSPPTWSRRSARCSRSSTRNEGKPEQAWPKIVEGRLNGFYKDDVPARAGVREGPEDDDRRARRRRSAPMPTVRRFARVKIGEE